MRYGRQHSRYPGIQGTNGTTPGQAGTAGGAGGPAVANNSGNGADSTNTALATGGQGGKGGDGGSGTGTGGNGGAGGAGGAATASTTVTQVTAATLTSRATATGGYGGSAGPPGNSGTASTGRGAAGGAGATAKATASATNSSGAAYAQAITIGGLGGGSFGPGGIGGAGGVAGNDRTGNGYANQTTASANGTTSATAIVSQTGGKGGAGNTNADGGAGASSVLDNAVTGSTTGGTLTLRQTATGGAGGASNGGTAGGAGGASSFLTFEDRSSTHASSGFATSNATGGAGGSGQSATNGAVGGSATAFVEFDGYHSVSVTGRATGGLGGGTNGTGNGGAGGGTFTRAEGYSTTTGSESVTVTGYGTGGAGGGANGTGSGGAGNGGAGGQAQGGFVAATELNATGGVASARMTAAGGAGGIGRGAGHVGGAGGTVVDTNNFTTFARGFNARAVTIWSGGNGGNGLAGANGGAGASITIANKVAGYTNGGYLILDQTANGGSGGNAYGPGGVAGAAGSANSSLTFADPRSANSLTSINRALGGNAGSSINPGGAGGGAGGAATASLTLTGAHLVSATSYATGGIGGKATGTYTGSGGAGSANAAATSTGTAGGDKASARTGATGGAGTARGQANATSSATTAAGQLATAISTANGVGGQAQATGATHGSGVVVTVSGVATATVAGNTTAYADVESSTVTALSSTNNSAYTSVTELPSDSGVVAPDLHSHPNVNAKLGTALASVFGAGVQSGDDTGAAGLQEYKSTDTFTLNTSALGGHLIAGLLDSTSTGTAFNTLEFTAQVGGTTVVDQTFTTLTAAQNFFHDNPVDLGAAPASANLQVELTFDLKASAAGSFGMDYLLGVAVSAPVINVNGATTTTDEASVRPFAGFTVSDPDNQPGVAETVTIAVGGGDANGMLSGNSKLTETSTPGVYTLTDTLGNLAADVQGLSFTPTAHQVAQGQSVTTSFSLSVTQESRSTSSTSNTATTSVTVTDATAFGNPSQYNIANDNGSLYIQDLVPGRDGTQILPASTQINFTDGTGVFDPTGNAEEVARLYQAALGRAPDVGGLDGWTAQLNAHTLGIDGVALGFINSAEFSSKYGALNNADFVTQLYHNVLHRAPDSAGEQGWINQLNSGVSRAHVLIGFSDSLENKLDTQGTIGDPHMDEAYRLYQAALDRTPDIPGLGFWTAQLDSGISPLQVAQGFVGSDEFARLFAGLDTKGFVDELYQNVLHRAPDSAGEQSWINQLNSGVSKARVLLGFSNSLENRLNTSQATHDSWVFVHS